jgi:DNA-binding NtrC family response regulator
MTPPAILVVDDDADFLAGLAGLLEGAGHAVHRAASGREAIACLADTHVDLVITDLLMPGLDGLEVLRQVKRLDPEVDVLVITGYGTIETTKAALREGALDYVLKPVQPEIFLHDVRRALDGQALLRRARAHEAQTPRPEPLVAESPVMTALVARLPTIAQGAAPVLLLGESGTGKDLVARALHTLSPRRAQPFVPLNCAAIPEPLVEGELFGYEAGAFTGATRRKHGHFELASGSTLLLDEIAELPLPAQSKLLRVLEERRLLRLGGVRPVPIDVRILAATNQDLPALVRERRFREDLYYRLTVGDTLILPPLRDRPQDLRPLAEHFLLRFAREHGKPFRAYTADALARLHAHRWPGNVRELTGVVGRAVRDATGPGPELDASAIVLPGDAAAPAGLRLGDTATLAEMTRWWILTTLARCGGHVVRAAEALGIDRSTLHRKLQDYGEQRP